jgi:hypothetical protein
MGNLENYLGLKRSECEATYFRLVLRLRMHEYIPALCHMMPWSTQVQFYTSYWNSTAYQRTFFLISNIFLTFALYAFYIITNFYTVYQGFLH